MRLKPLFSFSMFSWLKPITITNIHSSFSPTHPIFHKASLLFLLLLSVSAWLYFLRHLVQFHCFRIVLDVKKKPGFGIILNCYTKLVGRFCHKYQVPVLIIKKIVRTDSHQFIYIFLVIINYPTGFVIA